MVLLHGPGHYKEAFDEFEMMLSRMKNSLDLQVRGVSFSFMLRRRGGFILSRQPCKVVIPT